ncbi:MAG: hypothetical protein QW244_03170 [Candidatus Pacearchaeota archaeon]
MVSYAKSIAFGRNLAKYNKRCSGKCSVEVILETKLAYATCLHSKQASEKEA